MVEKVLVLLNCRQDGWENPSRMYVNVKEQLHSLAIQKGGFEDKKQVQLESSRSLLKKRWRVGFILCIWMPRRWRKNPEKTERCALTQPGLRRCPWRRSSLHLTWVWWRPALHSTEPQWLWWRPWWSRRSTRSPLSWRSPSHPSDLRRYLSQWCYLGD